MITPFIYKITDVPGNSPLNYTPLRDDIFDCVKDAQKATEELQGKKTDEGCSRLSYTETIRSFMPSPPSIVVDNSVRQNGLVNYNSQDYSHNSTYVNTSSRPNSREKKEKSYVLEGIFAAVILGTCAYIGGKTYGTYARFSAKLKNARKFQEKFNFESNIPKNAEQTQIATQVQQIKDVNKCAKTLFKHVSRDAMKNIALAATIAAGAALALLGAILSSPALIITGSVIGGAGIVASLFKWGMGNPYKEQDDKLIETIQRYASSLLAHQRPANPFEDSEVFSKV